MSGALAVMAAGPTPAGFAVALSNRTVTDVETNPDNALAGFRLGTDGKIYQADQTGNSNYGEIAGAEWLDPKDAAQADNYEARATVTSGSFSVGTNGVWQQTNVDLTYERSRVINVKGTTTAIFTLEIRPFGGGATLTSAVITLEAEVA